MMIEFILELLVEIALDLSYNNATNKKRSLWIRAVCIFVLIAFACLYLFIFYGIGSISIIAMKKENYLIGIIMLLLVFVLIFGVYNFIKDLIMKYKSNLQNS